MEKGKTSHVQRRKASLLVERKKEILIRHKKLCRVTEVHLMEKKKYLSRKLELSLDAEEDVEYNKLCRML